jgi:hypothetical protein
MYKKCDVFVLILSKNVIYLQMLYNFLANKAHLHYNITAL